MSDVRINTRSPYYIEANPTAPDPVEIPDPIEENTPPTVTITASNENPFVNETVTLTAVATDSDGTITNYLWGGTTTPQTTVSIDVTSSTVQSKIFYVVVTDDDGDTANAQITINWQEIPEQIINTDIDVECGDIINEGSFSGTKTYNLVGVGNKVGDVEIEFLGGGGNQNHPVVFDLSWNGATVTSGYIGDSNSVDGTLQYTDNTGDPTTKGEPTTLTINKSAASPSEVVLTARPFETNDSYSFRLNCPQVDIEQTFYYTLTGTCTSGTTEFTYTDVNGVTQTVELENGEVELVSAQEDTVSLAVCTGITEKGGESFELGTPTLELNDKVEINIIFDDSGSMNSTLEQLERMTEGTLKNELISAYNDDSSEYSKRVTVLNASQVLRDYGGFESAPFISASDMERYLRTLTLLEKRNTDSTKVVNIFFLDEVLGAYKTGSGVGYSAANQNYIDDLASYRSFLDTVSYGTNLSVLAKVDFENADGNAFISNIYNGTNGFEGSKGLSDRSEAKIITSVQDGNDYSSNPTYYSDIVLQALREFGYNI